MCIEIDRAVIVYTCRSMAEAGKTGASGGSAETQNGTLDNALNELQDMYEGDEPVGADIHEALASFVDAGLRRKPGDKKLLSTHPRPGNVGNLTSLQHTPFHSVHYLSGL